MYIKIDGHDYTRISDLSFVTEADVTGNTVPADEANVTIKTSLEISAGQYMQIIDDQENVWTRLWIVDAHRVDAEHVEVKAMSGIFALERKKMRAVMYNAESAANVLDAIFAQTIIGVSGYVLDNALQSATISGFCPAQNARERLQWVCFVLGAFVKQSFTANNKIEIKKISQDIETIIPPKQTKYRPVRGQEDYVSKITITAYSFTLAQGEPATTDEWVKAGSNVYIVHSQEHSISNPDFPSTLPDNEVVIDGLYLVNENNVQGILSYFAGLYFNRLTVSLDAINNFEFTPGEKTVAYTDMNAVVSGYIASCAYSFGLQAVSSIQLVSVEDEVACKLTIRCLYAGNVIAKFVFYFPQGYTYSVKNPYIDRVDAEMTNRYVYRPSDKYTTGRITENEEISTQNYGLALHFEYENGILEIADVNEVDWYNGREMVMIG